MLCPKIPRTRHTRRILGFRVIAAPGLSEPKLTKSVCVCVYVYISHNICRNMRVCMSESIALSLHTYIYIQIYKMNK